MNIVGHIHVYKTLFIEILARFQTTLSQLNTLLKEAEERWETTSEVAPRSLPDLQHHIADIQVSPH